MTKSEEYREGDLIRATKNGEAMQGKLRPYQSTLGLDEAGWGLDSLEKYGWIVELIERSPDRLPTEPGYYLVTLEDGSFELWKNHGGQGPAGPEVFDTIERLYTKDDVIAKARKIAFSIDPDYVYGGPEQVLIMELQHVL